MSREKIELELYYVAETGLAYGVTEDELDGPTIWLPKSQVEMVDETTGLGEVAVFQVPEWLALEKGLI